MISLLFPLMAEAAGGNPSRPGFAADRDTALTASLITCYPGPRVYELCGHEAIRMRGPGIDSVWNYGVFDFTERDFIYRFVKGETDYMVESYPFSWFLPEYMARGSKVVEQDLNLTPAETRRLLQLLRHAALPANKRYRYNYLYDNCATRIVDRVEDVTGPWMLRDTVSHTSFREAMRDCHRNYPWYQFGIDLALGSGLDGPLSAREEMFLPLQMMRQADNATLPGGRPLVSSRRVLYEGRGDMVYPPTPWWLTPMFWSIVTFALIVLACVMMAVTHRIFRWIYALYFGICGAAGMLVTFLVVFSQHAATSPNLLIYWLNPLQLTIPFMIWSRRCRPAMMAMMVLNIGAVGVLLIVWPFQTQSANPAFFPLMGSAVALALTYAITLPLRGYKKRGGKRQRTKATREQGAPASRASARTASKPKGVAKKARRKNE